MNAYETIMRGLMPEIKAMLNDYLHKLETDDYDPLAIHKMENVNELLAELDRRELQ